MCIAISCGIWLVWKLFTRHADTLCGEAHEQRSRSTRITFSRICKCGQSARTSVSTTQSKKQNPSLGYPCMEHARESRDKLLEQYGVNGKSVTLTRSSQDSAAPRQTKKRRNGSPAPVNMRMTSLKERGLCSELYKRASWHQAQLFEYQLQHGGSDIGYFFHC